MHSKDVVLLQVGDILYIEQGGLLEKKSTIIKVTPCRALDSDFREFNRVLSSDGRPIFSRGDFKPYLVETPTVKALYEMQQLHKNIYVKLEDIQKNIIYIQKNIDYIHNTTTLEDILIQLTNIQQHIQQHIPKKEKQEETKRPNFYKKIKI